MRMAPSTTVIALTIAAALTVFNAVPAAAACSFSCSERVYATHRYVVPTEGGGTMTYEIETRISIGDGGSSSIDPEGHRVRRIYVIDESGDRQPASAEERDYANTYLATPNIEVEGYVVTFDTTNGTGVNPTSTTAGRHCEYSGVSSCTTRGSYYGNIGTRPES